MKKSIIVKTCFNGKHRWKQAPKQVSFLKEYHDHIFFVEAEIEVFDSDRELEFFIVKREIDSFLLSIANTEFQMSCEMIAEEVCNVIKDKFGEDRKVIVSVYEDNNNGGRYYG